VIGPAGENRVRYATISHENRHAGRGGLGAVMGSKNLKAIAVAGTQRVEVADPSAVIAAAKDLSRRSFGPATAKYRELGTVANLLTFNRLAALPASAWKRHTIERAGRYRHPRLHEDLVTLKGISAPVRQIAIKNIGRDQPTLLITNDLQETTPAKDLVARYAERMLIENELDAYISGFSLNALSSSVPLNVDLDTTLTVTGEAAPLPAAVDLAAYRIVQESLTNAIRHAGPATAAVSLGYSRDELRIDVTDTGRGPALAASSNGGHGLTGMRERATTVGGTLETGPGPAGGFRVAARLPFNGTPIALRQGAQP